MLVYWKTQHNTNIHPHIDKRVNATPTKNLSKIFVCVWIQDYSKIYMEGQRK